MANPILIKRKTTTGAPSLGQLADGEQCWNQVDDEMYIRTDGVIKKITQTLSKGVTIPNVEVGDKATFMHPNIARTVTRVSAILEDGTSSPSVSFTLYKATTRNGTGTEVITSGTTVNTLDNAQVVTTFNAPSVAADEFLWMEVTSVSGDNVWVNIEVTYTED